MFRFELGEKVVDEVTNYGGVITARAEYNTGEDRYLIESKDTTGRPTEYWYDDNRLYRVEKFPD